MVTLKVDILGWVVGGHDAFHGGDCLKLVNRLGLHTALGAFRLAKSIRLMED